METVADKRARVMSDLLSPVPHLTRIVGMPHSELPICSTSHNLQIVLAIALLPIHEIIPRIWIFPLACYSKLGHALTLIRASSDLKTGIRTSPINLHGRRLVSLFWAWVFLHLLTRNIPVLQIARRGF